MIWLTLRQFRVEALVAVAVLGVVAIVLALTGLHLADLYDTSGITTCHAHGDCPAVTGDFLNRVNASLTDHLPLLFGTALVAIPAVIGMFWGVPPITRELNARTHRLTLSKSVSRTRWLAIKLSLIGLAAMVTAGLFSLMVTWSASPIDTANMNRLLPAVFSERGIAPIGYAVFAVALGVTAGMLIRRTVPAMAVTLAVFTAVQFAMRAIRPHLIAPVHLISAITAVSGVQLFLPPGSSTAGTTLIPGAPGNLPGAWILSTQTINAAGHIVSGVPLSATGALSVATCGGGSQYPSHACFAELAKRGYRQLVTYQPAGRFWAFQWYETAIFVALALALAGFCFWWIRRPA
jgi:hypothetical protein